TARGDPVQVQRGHAGPVGAAVEDGRVIEGDRVLVDAQPPARITYARVSGTTSDPPPGAPVVCLCEVLVDFICERPLEEVTEGGAFVPHFGGSVANIAVIAARHGARVALASGAGEDPWGRWLRERLRREQVDLSLFELVPD